MSFGLPMSEERYLAIGKTRERIELFDGSLYMTPAPTPRHQIVSRRLANALEPEADHRHVLEAVNVRLKRGRVLIPDVVVASADIDVDESVIDVAQVSLVCEIVSPSNANVDRVLKMHYYAAAGIPWYLLVDHRSGTLHLYELTGSHYIEHSTAERGQTLELTEPVTVSLCPDDLLPPR
nr:Uma2 family endonuclease [Mangrovihabitans endophyticus]